MSAGDNLPQATSVIEAAAGETRKAVDRLFPANMGEAGIERGGDGPEVGLAAQTWVTIPARKTGYIQAVDADALFNLACEHGKVMRMERGIGEFVIEASPLASVAGKQQDEESIRKLNAAYTVGPHRTMQQDAAYGIRQIVDVALKALLPGINDTTTAINCVDFLGTILARPPVVRSKALIAPTGGSCESSRGGQRSLVCWSKPSTAMSSPDIGVSVPQKRAPANQTCTRQGAHHGFSGSTSHRRPRSSFSTPC